MPSTEPVSLAFLLGESEETHAPIPPVAPIYFVARNSRGTVVGAEIDAMRIQSVTPNSKGGSTVEYVFGSSYEVDEPPTNELIEQIELLRLDTWLEEGGPQSRSLS